jgi:DegV family protein with EDD domain
MNKKVALVTESQTCIPRELVERYDIKIVPFILIMGEKQYLDGVDIDAQEFYRKLASLNGIARTASASPGDYLKAFSELSQRYESILVITISQKISASYQSAMVAASQFDAVPVKVLDSGTAAAAQGLVVLRVARSISEGANLEESCRLAGSAAKKAELYAYINTFEFLQRSGRVRPVEALTATALSIKPVFSFKDGEAKLIAMRRGVTRAKDCIVERASALCERMGTLETFVFHANDWGNCQDLATRIREKVVVKSIYLTEFTPVMGAHTGPGVVGAAFLPE